MCGIAGIVTFGHGFQERWHNELIKMNQAIVHRGRSGHGHYTDKTQSCFLTHRRLSIIDLSDLAAQPMTSVDGRYVMVFNGEIYNYQEIAATLGPSYEGIKSDTAVLLSAYAMHGPSIVHNIRGMFAFAIWDTVEQSLFLARDHVGIKPLYFSHELVDGKKVFTFASELKAFFSTSYISRRINKRALVDYLTYYCVNAPLTLLEKVYALEPGHYMILDKQGLKSTRYWHPQDIEIDNSLINSVQIKKMVADTLDQSVALAMCADIEVGAFLSGGIDSTTIVGLMKRHTQKNDTNTLGC